MRIGIDVSRAFANQKTGTETYSYQIVKHLLTLPEAREHEWVLYVRPNSKFEIKNFKLNSNLKLKILNYPRLWTQFGLALSTWTDELDVLWIPAHTLPVFRKPGLKTVVTIHGIEYEWLPAYENWLQRWYLPLSTQYAVHSAHKIIAVSEFTRDQLIERLGVDPAKISVVYEGTNFRDPKRSTKIGERYLLFIGTVQPRKNLVRLIKAYLALGTKHLALIICGKLGWGYEEVVKLARQHNVVLTGFVSQEKRDQLLKGALAYVQPSITEGFGLPVLEAMHAGVPVVSSNGGALAEIVGNAGLLFDPLDVSDISDKLVKIINNPKLRKELITKGHLRARKFSWEKAAKETYRILTKFKI